MLAKIYDEAKKYLTPRDWVYTTMFLLAMMYAHHAHTEYAVQLWEQATRGMTSEDIEESLPSWKERLWYSRTAAVTSLCDYPRFFGPKRLPTGDEKTEMCRVAD